MSHSVFIEKFIERLGKIDPQRIERYLSSLAEELSLFEGIFESMPEGIIVFGKNKKILLINHNAEKYLDLKELSGGRLIDDVAFDDSIKKMIMDAIQGTIDVFTGELEVTYPVHRILSLQVTSLVDTNKLAIGAVVILSDITEKKIYQQQLARNEKIDSLSLLAGGVAHELGNPINSIGIHLQLIERLVSDLGQKKREKIIDHVLILKEEIRRLDRIIQSFLGAVRPIKGEFEEEDINHIIEEALKIFGPELKHRHIEVKKDLDVTLPGFLMLKTEISQAIINIIKNAMDAMNHGGVLSLSTSIRDDKIVVKITDTGPGIVQENLSRIFDPYFTTKEFGSGLGLMIVQRILVQHSGHIEVESRQGIGTTFKVILPCRKKKRQFLITSNDNNE
ncbi:PAS domain S-box protein [PVC group bacterium]|nr:PAS domain S-box protein [PVC group bacterium]